ncbi:MAG: RDD family protein, partial [Cellulomonadaceae bacterium]|nr:RDD family protein [Cellulomonadaceae bacterium]
IDWALCLAVSGAFFASADAGVPRLLSGDPTATLVVFALSTVVLVSVLGHTVGHRVLGLRVARVQRVPREAGASAGGATAQRVLVPGPPGLLAGALRTLLLCLVIPAVVWGADGRGLHDVAAGTVIVRR